MLLLICVLAIVFVHVTVTAFNVNDRLKTSSVPSGDYTVQHSVCLNTVKMFPPVGPLNPSTMTLELMCDREDQIPIPFRNSHGRIVQLLCKCKVGSNQR